MSKYRGVQKKGHLYYGYVYYKNKVYWSRGFTTAKEASLWRAKIKTELTREDHSHRSDYHWRCTQANDHEKLNAAYNRFTGQNRTLEQYLWQWVKTPFEPSESWVLEYTRTGEIVGHHGVMYLPFTQRGESIGGGKTENTFIDRHHAPKVFYLALEKKALQAMQNRLMSLWPGE